MSIQEHPEKEVELLKEHLEAISNQVLDTYPDAEPLAVGNWMLLAAIDALVAGDKVGANYHVAWFLEEANTMTSTTVGSA